jgi:hypothetical protein
MSSASGLTGAGQLLYQLLTGKPDSAIDVRWRDLLLDVDTHRSAILNKEFESLRANLEVAKLSAAGIASGVTVLLAPLGSEPTLLVRVRNALPPLAAAVTTGSASTASTASAAATETDDEETVEARYVIRCVYQRPLCQDYCPAVVSRPSRSFQLASFFDSDAPVRPLKIRMPVDTSLKGLSKFPRGVSIQLSKKLREQMARAQQAGLKDLSDGKVGAETAFDLGVICSFSIPIITICALILLMIIVQLLNIVFWWLPLFRICFPVKR